MQAIFGGGKPIFALFAKNENMLLNLVEKLSSFI